MSGLESPADYASRGLYPLELSDHTFRWKGPNCLKHPPADLPKQDSIPANTQTDEEKEFSLLVIGLHSSPVIQNDQFSNFTHLKRVTSYITHFVKNCKAGNHQDHTTSCLTTPELQQEKYWIRIIQVVHFKTDIEHLENKQTIPISSSLTSFLADSKMLRVGGRHQLSQSLYRSKHPLILPGKHKLTHPIIQIEHL